MAGELSLTRQYNYIYSIMRDEVEPILWDNVSTRTSLLYRMKELGAIIKTGGKPHLRFTILKELPTAVAYTDLDTITPVRGSPFTSAVYNWKQIEVPVQVSGLDMIKTGDDGIEDLLGDLIETAEIAMRDGIGGSTIGIYSDGDEDTLTKLSGLANHFTSSTTTGTVGGLSRATLAKWRHQSQNVSSAFDTNGLNRMTTLFRECSRYDETPDTIVLTGAAWDNYLKETTRTFQTNQPHAADSGMVVDALYPNIRFGNALIIYDDGCPANYGYFLNLRKFIRLFVREGRDAELGDFIKSKDKDDLVSFILWAGNLINTNLARGGVLLNADTY
jgi:hypothetical protein